MDLNMEHILTTIRGKICIVIEQYKDTENT